MWRRRRRRRGWRRRGIIVDNAELRGAGWRRPAMAESEPRAAPGCCSRTRRHSFGVVNLTPLLATRLLPADAGDSERCSFSSLVPASIPVNDAAGFFDLLWARFTPCAASLAVARWQKWMGTIAQLCNRVADGFISPLTMPRLAIADAAAQHTAEWERAVAYCSGSYRETPCVRLPMKPYATVTRRRCLSNQRWRAMHCSVRFSISTLTGKVREK